MPDVPPPEECVSFRDPPPPEAGMPEGPLFPFWTRCPRDARRSAMHRGTRRSAAQPGRAWFRFEQSPTDEHGGFDPLALLVAADMMPSAVFEKVGTSEHGWFAPSVDLTVHLTGVPSGGWILNHNRAHYATDGYPSAECALWDPYTDDGPTLLRGQPQIMVFSALRFD